MRLGSYLERFTENYVGVKVFDLQTNVLLLYGTMQDKRFADSIKPYYTYMVIKQGVWDNWLLVYISKPLGKWYDRYEYSLYNKSFGSFVFNFISYLG